MPKPVVLAIILIWISLFISMALCVIQKMIGTISSIDFIAELSINALMCLIPYKLARQSNMARHVFLVLFVASILFLLAIAEEIELTLLDKVELLINIPLNIYSIYWLFFNKKAQQWFSQQGRLK